MSKIYEIKFNSGVGILEKLDILKDLGDFSTYNNYYYISAENIDSIKQNVSHCNEINKLNYQNIPNDFCKEWCLRLISADAIKQFEIENQDYLKQVNARLDVLLKMQEDGNLNEYIENINKKGGTAIEPKETSDE